MPRTDPATADPFGTAELRSAVLDSWRRSPARLREDANAEESLAMVGYAGRVVVELAANAADAAIAAGVPGRIQVSVHGTELRVANNGAPLTAAGVASLASLRASAKRADASGIGHFGVGFTAVLAVSDHPSVISSSGSVSFSGQRTADAIAELRSAELDAEVTAREGHVPVLRLPWPIAGTPPDGFSTEVRLPLRPGVDVDAVLAEIGDHLLLAMPGLEWIGSPARTLSRESADGSLVRIDDNGAHTSWHLVTRSGQLNEEQRAGLPTEQRRRGRWRISWALPANRPLAPDVLYSPTPTDELLDLPARLIGTFPVDDTRRHLAAGPITDLLLDEAVGGYLELMADTAPEERLRLLPAAGFGRSEVDNRLRNGIWHGIRSTPLLVSVAGEAVRPDQAATLPGASAELIALASEAIPGLLPAPRDGAEREALRALGVRTISVAELSTALGALSREPEFWGRLYAELDAGSSDDLADLPIPLAGGRTVLGARGCLLLESGTGPDTDDTALAGVSATVPGLRVVHPAAAASPAARRVLLRIGAQIADPTAVLADPAVLRTAAELRQDLENDDAAVDTVEAFGAAVLDLVAAGAAVSDELRAELLLTTADGEPWPVGELLLPGAPLAAVLADDADLEQVAASWVQRYDAEVLQRAGVLAGFRVVHDNDPHGPDHDLPDEDEYWDRLIGDRPAPSSFTAVADLDLVADDRWPAALELIRTDRATRETVRQIDGLPSYTAWWLRRFALMDDRPPTWWRLRSATDLAHLYDVLPLDLDDEFAAAIGVRSSLSQLLIDDPVDALLRFTDPARTVPPIGVPGYTAAIVAALTAPGRPPLDELPSEVRVMSGAVVDADDAVVLDEPWLAQVLSPDVVVPGGVDPATVAALFDLELASERHVGEPPSDGDPPDAATTDRLLSIAAGLVAEPRRLLDGVVVNPDLKVGVPGAAAVSVRWWSAGGRGWVDGSPESWGRLLAYRARDWTLRHTVTALVAGRRADVVEDACS